MFSVYGVTGQVFRGTLERLVLVPEVLPSSANRRLRRKNDEPDAEPPASERARERETEPYRVAAEAYARAMKHQTEREPILHAYQIMSRDILALRPGARVDQAWRALRSRGVNQAPVLEGKQPVGLVAVADLLRAANVENGELRDILERTVREVMVSPVVSADPVTDIRRVARVLLDFGLPAIPVVDEREELLGIISRSDILRAVMTDPPLSLWA